MKKVRLSLIGLMLVLSLFLSACREQISADEVLRNFLGEYPLAEGVIFSSCARIGDAEYADETQLRRLYGETQLPLYASFAVYLYSDMDTVRECGIFVIRDGLGASDDMMLTQDLIYERIHLVTLAFPEIGARLMRFGNTLAYVIVPDLDRAQHLLSRLVHS